MRPGSSEIATSVSFTIGLPIALAIIMFGLGLDLTLADIGRQFGGRDHSTVLHAVRRVAAAMETPGVLTSRVENLRTSLRAVVAA